MLLLVHGRAGILAPHLWAKKWGGRSTASATALQALTNPDNEGYWDAWDEVLAHAVVDLDGIPHSLYQENASIFAVPPGEEIYD